jgi:hypothetical protein
MLAEKYFFREMKLPKIEPWNNGCPISKSDAPIESKYPHGCTTKDVPWVFKVWLLVNLDREVMQKTVPAKVTEPVHQPIGPEFHLQIQLRPAGERPNCCWKLCVSALMTIPIKFFFQIALSAAFCELCGLSTLTKKLRCLYKLKQLYFCSDVFWLIWIMKLVSSHPPYKVPMLRIG